MINRINLTLIITRYEYTTQLTFATSTSVNVSCIVGSDPSLTETDAIILPVRVSGEEMC